MTEYFEGAAILSSLAMLGAMWAFLQKLISNKLKDLSDIIVKLIDRHNSSDNSADRRQEQVTDKIDSLEREVCDLKERISYLQGRINGK
jgi:peptidoglycan hydrolase CwlO-like protein